MRQTCFWYYDPISFNARTWVVWNFAFPSYLFIFTWFFSPLKHPFELTSFHFTLSLSFFIFLPPSPTHTHTHAHTHTRRTYNSIFLRLTSSYTFHLTWHKPLKAFFFGGGEEKGEKIQTFHTKTKKKNLSFYPTSKFQTTVFGEYLKPSVYLLNPLKKIMNNLNTIL